MSILKRICKIKQTIIIAIICIAAALTSCSKYKTGGPVLIKNVNIIPMDTEQVLENYAVFIKSGKIEQTGKFEDLTFPKGTRIIDGKNRYLIPGLGDMHVHIYNEHDGALYLANGVTLVRNMWGNSEILEKNKEVRSGKRLWPEVYTTGPLIDGKYPVWPGSFILDNPKDVEEAIKKMHSEGYDAIKVYNKLSLEVYKKIVKTAHSLDIPVVGHVPGAVGLEKVITSGQQSIEHFTGYNTYSLDEKEINLTVQSGIWNCPTLTVMYKITNLYKIKKENIEELKYVAPEAREYWSKRGSIIFHNEGHQKLLKTLYDRGANIVAGTDVGNPYVIAGFSMHEELARMNNAGLSPYEVLLTATKNPARMLGYGDRLGTIEAGKDADLVLLEKNPLEDIANTKTIVGVMTKGRWLPKKELQKMLAKVARENKNK